MAQTDYDVTIGSTSARIKRGVDGSYRKRTIRREVEQQLLSQSEVPALVSRADYRQIYQTDWSAGSRWWKPLVGQDVDNYFTATGLDVWTRPGSVYPVNNKNTVTGTSSALNAIYMAASDENSVYLIGSTLNDDATQNDVYKWSGSAWVQETGYSSGISNADALALAFDPSDSKFYNVSDDGFVNRFTVDTGEDKDWISGVTVTGRHFDFCLSQHGLFLYDGNELFEVDKATPALTSRVDDGLGLNDSPLGAPPNRLAVGTPEGIYYAKNLLVNGLYQAWIFRVDRDQTGAYITEPIATLPYGSIITSIAFHLGSLVVAAADADSKAHGVITATPAYTVTFYSIDNQSGISVLGKPQDGDAFDDTVAWIVAATGTLLYVAGFSNLYVYDGARGGIHKVHDLDTTGEGNWASGALYQGTSDETSLLVTSYYQDNNTVNTTDWPIRGEDSANTLSSFYQLESNFFDFGLPMETKELTKVEILRDKGDGTSTWRVDIDADDSGSWTNILSHATTSETYASATLSGTTGRRFRYRLEYRTSDATERIPLRALKLTAATGEMITEWDLLLDGEEIINVDNEVQDPEDVYDNLVTIGDTATITTLSDNFQEKTQDTNTTTTVNVKVQAVEIVKNEPGEADIRVVLREA